MTHRDPSERPDHDPEATVPAGELRGDGQTVPARAVPATLAGAPHAATGGGDRDADALAQIAPVGGLFGGRFEIVEELGRGGMGAVYRARDRQVNGRELALKVLLERYSRDTRFRELFFQEIHAAQKFVSENVVQVRDTGQAPDGTLFLTMDLVQGESLRSLLDREHVLNPRQALEITRQVLEGLASGHEAGFVHRDIKPSNVMLAARVPKTDANPFGIGVRLLDFGIAGLAAQIDTGTLTGTPKYMSPEQVQAQRLDARSDLFAVGVLLYEMMSGARPFEGDTLEEITTSVIETDLAPMIARMEELSPPMRKILRRALQKDREKRFQNAAEFIRAIERSSAFRIPKVMPTWVLFVFVLVVIAAGVQAKVLVDQQSTLKAYEERLTSASGDEARAVQVAQGAAQEKIQLLESQLAEREALLGQRGDEVSALRAQIARTSDDLTLKDSVRYTDETELNRLRSELDSLSERQRRSEEAAAQVQRENEDLRQKLAERERQASLTGRLAEGFDDILARVVRGSGRSARAALELRKSEGLFDKLDLDGVDFLERLTNASARLHHAGEQRALGKPVDASELEGIESELAAAEGALSALEVQGRAWLDFRLRDGDADPMRMDAARAALAFALGQWTDLRTNLGAAAEDRWLSIESRGPLQDPTEALAYAKEHGRARPSQLLQSLAAALERDFVDGAELDFDRLGALSALEAWDAHLAGGPKGFDAAASGTVALFAHARRVHLGQEGRAFDWSPYPWAAVDAPTRDWRMELRLLDECWRGGALWPTQARGRAVYHNTRGSTLRWLSALWHAPTSDGWQCRQRQFKLDGETVGGEVTVSFQGKSRVLLRATSASAEPWLPLTLGSQIVGIAPLPPLDDVQPPSQLGLRASDLDAFRAEYTASSEPCLVVRGPTSTLWLSPSLGVVREEPSAPGVPAWNLVYAPPQR